MGISVDDWLVLYVHSLASILEGIETFLVVTFGRTDAGDHVGIGVSSKAVLQNAGQLAITIGDELRLFSLHCQS